MMRGSDVVTVVSFLVFVSLTYCQMNDICSLNYLTLDTDFGVK